MLNKNGQNPPYRLGKLFMHCSISEITRKVKPKKNIKTKALIK
jgi:hypothetical protein